MVITYHGADFFKVTFGDKVIAINPVSKDSSIKSSRFGADIALISSNDTEHNGVDAVSRNGKPARLASLPAMSRGASQAGESVAGGAPFVVNGPGEYEISGIFIKGYLSKTGDGRLNTIYTINLENMNLCFLGGFGEEKIPDSAKGATEDVDILFVPIGGNGTLDPHVAEKIANQFEPKVIIPSHFEGIGEKTAVKTFLKEAGAEEVKPTDKLTIKKKDIETMDGEVVVLSSVA